MNATRITACTAFNGTTLLASGGVRDVVLKAKAMFDADSLAQILIFDDASSDLVDVDLSGTTAQVAHRVARLEPNPNVEETMLPSLNARGPGRPKLGVVAREVTLLPRHWDWLASQPGGASVALRKLVEHARSSNKDADRLRQAQEAAYRFASAMAGDEPGFEEAIRALFAGKQKRFNAMVEAWPNDVREHAKKLAALAF